MNKKRVMIFFVVILLLFNITYLCNTISKTNNNRLKLLDNNYNKMKINSVNIISRKTGTAPFNTESISNEYGVDVSDSDDYVRTFDYVKYLLEIGISPNDLEDSVSDSSTFSGGIIKVKAKLPNQGNKILMTWEEDAWMKNVSYNDDKTEIYAEYHFSNDTLVSHANQSLSFTFKINGYKDEITEDMSPEFEVWMDGNKPDNEESSIDSIKYKDINNRLIISSKPSYDVDLKTSTYLYPALKDNVSGEYISYGVGVALIQPYNYINDLRGVEYPTGKFEIELDNKYYAKSNNDTDYNDVTDNINTQLISYSVNDVNNDNYYPTSRVYTRTLPKGIGGGLNGVTDSGNMNTTFNSNITTISFNNYKLNNEYPIRDIVTPINVITYISNLGYILAGNVQLFVPYYDNDSDNIYNYSYKTNIKSIKYYDSKGVLYEVSGNDEFKKSNNNITISFKKSNNGSFYVSSEIINNNTESRDGLASAYLGTYIYPSFTLMPVTGPYEKAERLIVWNTNYFELEKRNNNEIIKITCNSELGFQCNSNNNFELKYGIYKNNSEGIDSDELVNNAYFDDFIWYDTYDEAINNGRISAIYGLDNEVLGNRIHRVISPKFKVIDNTDLIGSVGIIVHRTRIYDTTGIIYEPNKNIKYKKTTYDNNGNVVSKHSSNATGLSVLVIGTKTGITTLVSDKEDNGNLKTNYDATDKEINIKIIPTLHTSFINTNNIKSDSVIVKSILPSGLNYKEDSSNKEPKEVINNIDGTTTIVWEYNDWIINEEAPDYPEITYKAEISSSIDNNKKLDISSNIYEEYDLRDINYRSSDYSVIISNLSGSKTLKQIDKPTLDIDEEFNITNIIGNISNNKLVNVKGLEILPKDEYNGTYKIKVLKLDNNQKLYYTTSNIDNLNIEEDINGRKIITDFDESLWNIVNEGEYIPSEATAIYTTINEINSFSNIEFIYNIIPENNKIGDKYTFVLNVISSNLSTAVKSNTIIAEVVERKISGIAFIDNNDNNKYDTQDTLLDNINVYLLDSNNNTIKTTKTDNNGNYIFDGLVKGNYYVKFDIPNNYKVISIDDNKVNNDGKTNIIEHIYQKDINNINLGITKKKGIVTTHYYYEDTDNSISNDIIENYLYGDNYTTKLPNNIPINYELTSIPSNNKGIVDKDNIEVIYYYKMKDSNIKDNINNNSTKVISDINDTIEYNINYNINIDNYIGNYNIIIKDILPYDIDIDNSYLDGGIYNSEDNTIIWEYNDDINTYDNIFNLDINKNIKIVYKDISNNIINNNIEILTTLSNNKSIKNDTLSTIVNPITKRNIIRSTQSNNDNEVSNIDNNSNITNDIEDNPKTIDNIYIWIIIFINLLIVIPIINIVRNKYMR